MTAWLATARAVHFVCCLLIAGVWSFDRLAAAPPPWRRIAAGLLLTATPLALLSGAVWFVLVAADMNGSGLADTLHGDVLGPVWHQTRFGRTCQVHAFFWLTGAIAAGVSIVTRRGAWFNLLLATGLVGGLAWAGHGSTGPAPAWHLAADVLHLLASGVWPGTLLPFALLLAALIRSAEREQLAVAARITRRFSAASLVAVGLLTATGLVNSYCLVGSIPALFTSRYGCVLLVKLGLFLAMITLGAINLLLLKPRISGGDPGAIVRLRWSVLTEAVLGFGVVAVVGFLGLLEPARH